jgi:CAAX prenyl protease-like protein
MPMAVFVGMMLFSSQLAALGIWENPVRVALMGGVIWYFSGDLLKQAKLTKPLESALLGLAVFALWIAPDVIAPSYRDFWFKLFQQEKGLIAPELLANPLVLVFRTLRAALIVPIAEELFWRGWLMRWIAKPNFWELPLGSYSAAAFWGTAALFALEHGAYWEVGLLCGVIYGWWMLRTKSIADLILTHAVTNLALSIYTITTKNWQYWL